MDEGTVRYSFSVAATKTATYRISLSPETECLAAVRSGIRERLQRMKDMLATCAPGYSNDEGTIGRGPLVNIYGGGIVGGSRQFTTLMDEWRARHNN